MLAKHVIRDFKNLKINLLRDKLIDSASKTTNFKKNNNMKISLLNAEKLHYGRNCVITVKKNKYKGILYEDCRIIEVYRKNLHIYGLRHSDDDWSKPVTISLKYPLVNFFGTFLTDKEIPITEEIEIEAITE